MTMTNTSKGHLTTTAGGTAKSTTCILILSLFLSSIFSTNFPRYVSAGSINSVKVKLRNESGEKLAVNWVNPNTQAAVLMNYVEPNRTYIVNSYVSHRFQILQVPDDDSGACGGGDGVRDEQEQQDGTCKVGYFQITQLEPEQAFVVKKGVQIEKETTVRNGSLAELIDITKSAEDPHEVLADCKARALHELERLYDNDNDKERIILDFKECILVRLTPTIKAADDDLEFERQLRTETSQSAENFTCVDTGLETSPGVRKEDWVGKDGVGRVVHIKLDRPASRIHVIENFASVEECEAIEEEAAKDLHIASTADGKGGTKISVGRKAWQAGIRPKFTPEGDPLDGNLIASLSGRVYEYTNHVLDLNLSHHGQEPLMSIQYFGRGYNDTEPDRYTPHCDGKCEGRKHIFGSRMATMVIYCTIPEKGGFTNFQNANVHVKPSERSAIFFSYIDPLTNISDWGFTQHSGCPVYEGEKKIITQWVRYGVDSKTTHNSFNTLQILRSEDGE